MSHSVLHCALRELISCSWVKSLHFTCTRVCAPAYVCVCCVLRTNTIKFWFWCKTVHHNILALYLHLQIADLIQPKVQNPWIATVITSYICTNTSLTQTNMEPIFRYLCLYWHANLCPSQSPSIHVDIQWVVKVWDHFLRMEITLKMILKINKKNPHVCCFNELI